MESFFSRFKNALTLIAILLVQTIGLAIQVRRPASPDAPDGRKIYLLRAWANASVSPFERSSHWFGGGLRHLWFNYLDLRSARRQNEALKQQIGELRLEQAAFAEDAIQGHRLQRLLAFQQHYIAHTVAAQVVGTSGSDLSRVLTLDKGRDDGLRPDMAVITPDGIVGKIRDVFRHTSQLLLLNDQTSGAGVILQTTRIRAVVRGTPTGRLQIGNLTADSRIQPGDTVLSSGGDLVFPRGLPIGTIESIAPDPDHQPYTSILLKPAANLSQLEEVLVITGMQAGISPQASQDLAQGAATAEAIAALAAESKRAADLLAERLPSLHDTAAPAGPNAKPDPNAPTTPAAQAGDLKNLVTPKASPPLHPDRYTPGTTAPASSLTPGGAQPAGETVAPTPTTHLKTTPTEPKQ